MEKQLSAHYVLRGTAGYVTGSGEEKKGDGCDYVLDRRIYAFDYSSHLDQARVFNTVRQALDFVEQTALRNAGRSSRLNINPPFSGGLWLVQIALESPPPPPLRRRIVKEYR